MVRLFTTKLYVLRLIAICEICDKKEEPFDTLWNFLAQNLLPKTISISPIYTLRIFIFRFSAFRKLGLTFFIINYFSYNFVSLK